MTRDGLRAIVMSCKTKVGNLKDTPIVDENIRGYMGLVSDGDNA